MISIPGQSHWSIERELDSAYLPISDYAIIGDCQSAALISRYSCIDWFCTPRFDSPSLFAAILDAQRGGRFCIRPTGRFATSRRYVGDTNVLETTFECAGGTLRVTDLMPLSPNNPARRGLCPDHEILRCIECVSGKVQVQVTVDPRPKYGKVVPRILRQAGNQRSGWTSHLLLAPRGMISISSEVPLQPRLGLPGLHGLATLRAGQRAAVSFAYTHHAPAIIMPVGDCAWHRLDETVQWWQHWANGCTFEGAHRPQVMRSALVLKLMAYAPSGAVMAAPTTSLPEDIGGVRNWDYRYCWPRDAFMTLRALMDVGYTDEGEAFIAWLLHATRRTPPLLNWMGLGGPPVRAIYDVMGKTHMPEYELDHFEGYRGSRPVNIGNGAADQLQLDVFGAVTDAAYDFVQRGGELERSSAELLLELGKTTCQKWREPDEGIWEVRSEGRHHTLSKVMCWLTLKRIIQLHEQGHMRWHKVPVAKFAHERDLIREAVETHGYNTEIESYVDEFNGDHLDASLLLMLIYEYDRPNAPRLRNTVERVQERLSERGFFYRYHNEKKQDGLPGKEGTFTLCGFWYAECLARQGRRDEAFEHFDHMYQAANDLGLFSEEYDVHTREMLGNFPQAYGHVGAIDAAYAIEHAHAPQKVDHVAV